MLGEFLKLLRSMPVFGGLKDESLEFILARSSSRRFSANVYLFRTGDAADSFFVIEQGEVVVERIWNSQRIELSRLQRGDCVGEMAVLDLLSRSAAARAAQEAIALEINRRCLADLYRQEPEQYAIILMNMGREVSRRLRKADDRLFELEQAASMLGSSSSHGS